MNVKACVTPNFGDTVNSELVKLISHVTPTVVGKTFNKEHYLVIGSILSWATENSVVWGSGFISNVRPTIPQPKAIHAVRGPLTRELLVKNGYECPEVYGDPALLLPSYFNPILEKKYEVSVIPHHIDKVLIPELKKEYPDAHFIDIQQPVYGFLVEVIQSKYIITSALHGCIMAYAYNVPYKHVTFSDKVLGNGFKFKDFEESKKHLDLPKLMEVCPFKK